MPSRFASSGTVATSRSASRAILALNVASNFLRDLVISVLHRLRQSRTLHTLTFGPISGVHFQLHLANRRQLRPLLFQPAIAQAPHKEHSSRIFAYRARLSPQHTVRFQSRRDAKFHSRREHFLA